MKRVLIVLVFSFVLSLSLLTVKSNACDQLNYWSSDDIALAMSTKLARGITNVATGWMEFPRAFYVTGRDDGIGKSIALGPFQGIFMTVVRTLTGAFEVVTFVVPAPGCYDPFLDRPLVWSATHQQEGVLIFNKDRSDRKYHEDPMKTAPEELGTTPEYKCEPVTETEPETEPDIDDEDIKDLDDDFNPEFDSEEDE